MIPYSKDTFKTIKGNVISINTVFNKIKQEKGLHLTMKSSSDEYIVHVCPQWYADKEKIEFKKGDSITVSGSTFIKDDANNIYTATLEYGDNKTLNLRDPDTGKGLWRGRHMEENKAKNQKKMKKKMEE